MLQCVLAGQHGEPLLMDQSKTLKTELMMLNELCDASKKAVLFKAWDASWNANSLEDFIGNIGHKTHQKSCLL